MRLQQKCYNFDLIYFLGDFCFQTFLKVSDTLEQFTQPGMYKVKYKCVDAVEEWFEAEVHLEGEEVYDLVISRDETSDLKHFFVRFIVVKSK